MAQNINKKPMFKMRKASIFSDAIITIRCSSINFGQVITKVNSGQHCDLMNSKRIRNKSFGLNYQYS